MNFIKSLFFFTTILCLPFLGSAQKKDSLYSANSVGFIVKADLNFENLKLHFLDSSLADYQNFNPGFQGRQLNQNLGHYGTANNNLVFNFNQQAGFNLQQSWFIPYLWDFEHLKYYRTKSTYTNLRYVSSGKQEQVFEVNLAKNIGRKINISLDFQRAISSGNLQLNDVDHVNLSSKIWYQSNSRRYNLLSAFIYNSLYNNENGGLANDSVFLKPQTIPIDFQPTKLSTAKNIFNQKSIALAQYYDFGKFKTITKDSIQEKIILPSVRLEQVIEFNNNQSQYQEKFTELKYYQSTQDSTSTKDFQDIQWIKNQVNIQLLEKEGLFIFGKAGIENNFIEYKQNTISKNLSYNKFNSDINFKILEQVILKNEFNKIIQGNFIADYKEELSLIAKIFKNSTLRISYTTSSTSPSLFSQKYVSNHFNWDNNFQNQQYSNYAIHYLNSKFKINISLQRSQIDNFIYLNKDAQSAQYNGQIIIDKLTLKKDFDFSIIHLENTIALQKASQKSIVALPLFSSYHSIFLEQLVFKKVMKLRYGFDVRFNSSYYANNYMPATGMYYLQDQVKLGDYPIVDFFVSAYLKRAKIFLKVIHLNQGISKDGYYLTQNYPIEKRALQLGVSWNFFD